MKKQQIKRFWLLIMTLIISSLVISACGPGEPTLDVDAQRTSFAQTANAQATSTAEALPTATPTEKATATATETVTPTPEVTPTLSETEEDAEGATPAEPEQPTSPPSNGADEARWLANDPPDNTEFAPGEEFTVTWTLENVGTSTWTTDYYIQFDSGAAMGVDGEEEFNLPYPVPPNTNVQISVDFIAPEESGETQSNWALFNTSDSAFYDFYVIIDVVPQGEEE
ncbi:MAG: NBR1-Ig-like domain-containing protein [Brevefilum sp.]